MPGTDGTFTVTLGTVTPGTVTGPTPTCGVVTGGVQLAGAMTRSAAEREREVLSRIGQSSERRAGTRAPTSGKA